MKRVTLIGMGLVLSTLFFTSCKKDYTCTCTTTIGGIAGTRVYDLPNQRPHDANEACERFESDLNSSNPGTTNCHL
jgi:hypothetical protein